mgnify:CR=1 FL=1
MSAAEALRTATDAGFVLLTLALALTVIRLWRGPTLADRILSLDTITVLAIGYIGVVTVRTGFTLYLDIAIAIGLVGFLSTIALTRYLMSRAERQRRETGEVPE